MLSEASKSSLELPFRCCIPVKTGTNLPATCVWVGSENSKIVHPVIWPLSEKLFLSVAESLGNSADAAVSESVFSCAWQRKANEKINIG